jgi:hypothetical protein
MRFQVDYESWFKEKSGTSPVALKSWTKWSKNFVQIFRLNFSRTLVISFIFIIIIDLNIGLTLLRRIEQLTS